MSLQDQTALVTGGSRGIGLAIALRLYEAGMRVAICSPEPNAPDALPEAILHYRCDVSDEAQVMAFFDRAGDAFGVPDLVVSNAGILAESPIRHMSASLFDETIAVNLRGSFLVAREAARRMSSGRLLFIASDLALLGREDMAAYCASKGGVVSMMKSLARELAPHILVNAIAPGSVETGMTAGMSPSAIESDLDTPLARFGRPDEIAAMALFLASEQASFITGQVVGVNGGSAI